MPQSTLRAAIIGLSQIGAGRIVTPAPHPALGDLPPFGHAAAYAALRDEVEIVAYCDLQDEALARFCDNWGETFPQARPYKDYRQMLEREHLDLVSVVTPDHLHADPVVHCAEAGVRAILCEKPVATTLEDIDRMQAAVQKHGTVISVDNTTLWAPTMQTMRKLIQDGTIGRVRDVIVTHGGDVRATMLFRAGVGGMTIILNMLDSRPAWVVGRLDEKFQNYGTEYAARGGHDPALDPGAEAWFGFENGANAHYFGQQGTVGGRAKFVGVEVIGETGILRIEPYAGAGSLHTATIEHIYAGEARLAVSKITPPQISHPLWRGAVGELIRVLNGTLPAEQMIFPLEVARWTTEMMIGILRSSHAGMQRIDLPLSR
jgi:predicted dehydrogenase